MAKNLELYFIDADMISLMYQENYLDVNILLYNLDKGY